MSDAPYAEFPMHVRPCLRADLDAMLDIVNRAAVAYEGVIPPDCLHAPYMSRAALSEEMARGVQFSGIALDGALVGIMGMERVGDVCLIRHAYVLPGYQGHGVGSALLARLCDEHAHAVILVGTWAAAHWAIGFYRRNGFASVPDARIAPLLRGYWNVPQRQIETSTVLSRPALSDAQIAGLEKGGGPAG